MQTSMGSLLFIMGTIGRLCAHEGQFTYPIYNLPPGWIDVNDGVVFDWEDAVPGPSLVMADFVHLGAEGVIQANDNYVARVFLGWVEPEQRVYIAVEAFDDVYWSMYDGVSRPGIEDGLHFFVDGDHSGGDYSNLEFSMNSPNVSDELKRWANASAQQYVAIPGAKLGRSLFSMSAGDAWVTGAPWAGAGGGVQAEHDGLQVTEFYVTPWDDLDWKGAEQSRRSALRPGQVIGLHITLYDYDGEDIIRVGAYSLGGNSLTAWSDAGRFSDAVLCAEQDCTPSIVSSLVEGETWARIKASLR